MWKRVGILVDAALPVCVKHQKAHTDQVRCLAVRIGLPEQVQLVKSLLLLDDVCYTIKRWIAERIPTVLQCDTEGVAV